MADLDFMPLHKCLFCNKFFRLESMLKKHMPIHFETGLLECDICGLQFQYPEQFHQHSIMHTLQGQVGLPPLPHPPLPHPPPPTSVTQQQQQQSQQQPPQQQNNNNAHNNNVSSSSSNHLSPIQHHSCPSCEADFPSIEILQQHFDHSSCSSFRLNSCPECGEKFFLIGELKRHAHMHRLNLDGFDSSGSSFGGNLTRSGKKKTFECPECHKFYSTYGNLKQHTLTHDGTRPFECEDCGKRFTTAGNLKQHRLKHTTDGKPHPCPICGKRYSTAGNLKQHKMRHLKARPFSCDLCGKSFSTAGILKQHAVVHTGIKMHRCIVCEKSFSSLGNLRQHELIHSRDHPTFSCLICNCWYTTAGNLKQHVAKKHGPGEKLTGCPRCKRRYYSPFEEGMTRVEDPNSSVWERICDACNGNVPLSMSASSIPTSSMAELSQGNGLDAQILSSDVMQDYKASSNPLCI